MSAVLDKLQSDLWGWCPRQATSYDFWRSPSEVPLPPFSEDWLPRLHSPEPLDKANRYRMAEVAASFYFIHHDHHLRHSAAYQLLGRRMMEVFPALMAEGPHPWTSFVKALRDKVRAKRFWAKRCPAPQMTSSQE